MRRQAGRTASYRLGPLGTAWDRINFFLRAQKLLKNRVGGLRFSFVGTQPVVGPPGRAPCRNVPEYAAWHNMVPGTGWKSVRRCGDCSSGNSPGRRPALQSKCAVPHAGGQPRGTRRPPSLRSFRLRRATARQAGASSKSLIYHQKWQEIALQVSRFLAGYEENRRFSTHFSPVRGLISRLLRRFRPIFIFFGARFLAKAPTSDVGVHAKGAKVLAHGRQSRREFGFDRG